MDLNKIGVRLNIDAGGKVELHQSVNRLRRWVHNIKHPLIRSNFKLFAAFFVYMGRSKNGKHLFFSW